jgi:hypothetical protein
VLLEKKIQSFIFTDYLLKNLFLMKRNSGFEKIVKRRDKSDAKKDCGLYESEH